MNSQAVIQGHREPGAGFSIKADISNTSEMGAADGHSCGGRTDEGAEVRHVWAGSNHSEELGTESRRAAILRNANQALPQRCTGRHSGLEVSIRRGAGRGILSVSKFHYERSPRKPAAINIYERKIIRRPEHRTEGTNILARNQPCAEEQQACGNKESRTGSHLVLVRYPIGLQPSGHTRTPR